jgi:hypothetical protein
MSAAFDWEAHSQGLSADPTLLFGMYAYSYLSCHSRNYGCFLIITIMWCCCWAAMLSESCSFGSYSSSPVSTTTQSRFALYMPPERCDSPSMRDTPILPKFMFPSVHFPVFSQRAWLSDIATSEALAHGRAKGMLNSGVLSEDKG